MQLADYLDKHQISDADFAALLGVERQTVHRWRMGQRMPRPNDLLRIRKVTGNSVTPNDFLLQREAAS